MKRIFFGILSCLVLFTASSQEPPRKMPGATMYFSDKPFTNSSAGARKEFSSSDFIYGRLELNGKTLKEAFGLPEGGVPGMANKNDCNLRFKVTVFKDGEQSGQPNFWDFLYVWEREKSGSAFNFDILPEPAKATSMLCGRETFSSGIAAGPLYHILNESTFPDNGVYTVRVKLYQESLNAWGKLEESEKWPVMEEEFLFNFNGKDIAKMKKNGETADELIMENAYHIDKIPDGFFKPGKVTDPKTSPAALSAIFKRDIPTKMVTKFVIAESSGPVWVVEKDDYGAIIRRTFMPVIHIAYKRDGKCYIGTLRLVEPYEGYGKYGTLTVSSESSSTRPDYWFDCGILK